MKKTKSIVLNNLPGWLAILCVLVYMLSSTTSKTTILDTAEVPIGTVIYNILPPEVFLNSPDGKGWALLDGREMSADWELSKMINNEHGIHQHLNNKLPDARGRFLRGMDHGGSDNDPKNNRKVGDYQASAIINHKHDYSFKVKKRTNQAGEHSHFNSMYLNQPNPIGYSTRITSAAGLEYDGGNWMPYFSGSQNSVDYYNMVSLNGTTKLGGEHSHEFSIKVDKKTEAFGGAKEESRPRNISFYSYIRVN